MKNRFLQAMLIIAMTVFGFSCNDNETTAEAFIEIMPKSLIFEYESSSQSFNILSNVAWTIDKGTSDWITSDRTNGIGDGKKDQKILITVPENTGPYRSGTITVSTGTESKQVEIIQYSSALSFGQPVLSKDLELGVPIDATFTIPYSGGAGTPPFTISVAVEGTAAAGINAITNHPVTLGNEAGGYINIPLTGTPTQEGSATFTFSPSLDGVTIPPLVVFLEPLTFDIPTISGSFMKGEAISGASITIPYHAAKGNETFTVNVAVSGVAAGGITVAPKNVTLTEAVGSFSLPISGTPASAGKVTFTISTTYAFANLAVDFVKVQVAGPGFNYAEIGAKKNFVELGYPGIFKDFTQADAKHYGDLQMYHAYCGNHIVLLSRAYSLVDPTSPYVVKVVDKNTLNDAGSLNLGSISIANLKMITSDYNGRCVGAVSSAGQTEFFYWTTPTGAPVSVGSVAVDMASFTDGANNFQVAGDIAGDAWITAMAPRNAQGEHYRIQVTNGQLASTYSMVSTGYSSGDCSQFQMISPLDDSDAPSYVIGDGEGTLEAANSIKCYINSNAGSTIAIMPGLWQNILQSWWVGTGGTTARVGGRRPVVSALVINGKSYVTVTSGTSFWHAAAVLDTDLSTLTHANLNIAETVTCGWSFGSWVDWYWDETEQAGYLAVWFGRLGLFTYKMTFVP
jgi:hypothetical protein